MKQLEKYNYFINNQDAIIDELSKIIDYKIVNKEPYIQSMINKAFACELNKNKYNNPDIKDNRSLATIGDVVLKLIITKFLYTEDKNITSEGLTNKKKEQENNKFLQEIGQKLNLKNISFSSNNEVNGKKALATLLEALIGAIYLDRGLDKAEDFVLKILNFKKLISM